MNGYFLVLRSDDTDIGHVRNPPEKDAQIFRILFHFAVSFVGGFKGDKQR